MEVIVVFQVRVGLRLSWVVGRLFCERNDSVMLWYYRLGVLCSIDYLDFQFPRCVSFHVPSELRFKCFRVGD